MRNQLSIVDRERVIELWISGKSCKEIVKEVGLSIRCCQYLVKYWEQSGEIKLANYSKCGLHNKKKEGLKEAALALKQTHSSWGAGLIRSKLSSTYDVIDLPNERTLSNWFKKKD